jgi:hypothetical protein
VFLNLYLWSRHHLAIWICSPVARLIFACVLSGCMCICVQTWGVAAAKAGVNLMEGCIAAIDGEKDPRCLLLAFELVQVTPRVL